MVRSLIIAPLFLLTAYAGVVVGTAENSGMDPFCSS